MKSMLGLALAVALLAQLPAWAQGSNPTVRTHRVPIRIQPSRIQVDNNLPPSRDMFYMRQFVHDGKLYTVTYTGAVVSVVRYHGEFIHSGWSGVRGLTYGGGSIPLGPTGAPTVSFPGRGFNLQKVIHEQEAHGLGNPNNPYLSNMPPGIPTTYSYAYGYAGSAMQVLPSTYNPPASVTGAGGLYLPYVDTRYASFSGLGVMSEDYTLDQPVTSPVHLH